MIGYLDPPLVPRDGKVLSVLGICRISTVHQDHKSLADQEAYLRRFVGENYRGEVRWEILASQVSGRYLDSATLNKAEALIESGRLDLVIAEDLARFCRRMKAYGICESAQDCGARLIAINDNVDTGREDWHLGAVFGAYRHEAYSRDTAKRIRRTLRNRFTQGGVVQFAIYGIIKPPGTKSDAQLRKDSAAEPVYDEWFRRLEAGASYAEICGWLTAEGIRPGPCCRTGRWSPELVRETTFNTILKGVRVRNDKITRRVNGTGRPRSVPAPPGERPERDVPHLAFIDAERYDRVVALLSQRNSIYGTKGAGGVSPCKGVPRKRTVFPGQHLTCGVCGRLYYHGGHGRKTHMMCSGNRAYRCWNGVAVDAAVAASKIAGAVLAEVAALPEFDPVFVAMVRDAAEAGHAEDDRRTSEYLLQEAEVARQIARLTKAIARMDESQALQDEFRSLEARRDELAFQRREIGRVPRAPVELPPVGLIRSLAGEAVEGVLRGSPEAGRLARRLIPRLEARPYRLCDGGSLVLRAPLTLDLAALIPDARVLEGRPGVLRRELSVDLFDMPQRAAHRERVVAMRAGASERDVAKELGLTVAAAQKAAALDRRMRKLGLTDPYMFLEEPPEDQARMRRHKHPRYRFEPLMVGPPPAAG